MVNHAQVTQLNGITATFTDDPAKFITLEVGETADRVVITEVVTARKVRRGTQWVTEPWSARTRHVFPLASVGHYEFTERETDRG